MLFRLLRRHILLQATIGGWVTWKVIKPLYDDEGAEMPKWEIKYAWKWDDAVALASEGWELVTVIPGRDFEDNEL